MTEERFIQLVDEWIETEGLLGCNCDETTIDDGQLTCYLEHWDVDGWVRQVYFNIPEHYLEEDIEDVEAKEFINRQMIHEIHEWGNDDEDMYQNIEFASYEDERETPYHTKVFINAQKRLKEY